MLVSSEFYLEDIVALRLFFNDTIRGHYQGHVKDVLESTSFKKLNMALYMEKFSLQNV